LCVAGNRGGVEKQLRAFRLERLDQAELNKLFDPAAYVSRGLPGKIRDSEPETRLVHNATRTRAGLSRSSPQR
jgi:hypothetical protein